MINKTSITNPRHHTTKTCRTAGFLILNFLKDLNFDKVWVTIQMSLRQFGC